MSETLEVQNGLQLSAIADVAKCAGDEVAGNDISAKAMGYEFEDDSILDLISARINVQLSRAVGGL